MTFGINLKIPKFKKKIGYFYPKNNKNSIISTELENKIIREIGWDKTIIEELDIRATELSTDTIISILIRLFHLRWLDASWLENFTDEVSFLNFSKKLFFLKDNTVFIYSYIKDYKIHMINISKF